MTNIPERGDRGKVLGVADDEVNMIRPTEDLVSGKDIRAYADGGGRRTESRRETGALPNVATSRLGKDRRQSTEVAHTSYSRKVGDSPEKGQSFSEDALRNADLRLGADLQGARGAMLESDESTGAMDCRVVHGVASWPMAFDGKVGEDPSKKTTSDNESQTKEPTQSVDEEDQSGSKDCSSGSEDDERDHLKATNSFKIMMNPKAIRGDKTYKSAS